MVDIFRFDIVIIDLIAVEIISCSRLSHKYKAIENTITVTRTITEVNRPTCFVPPNFGGADLKCVVNSDRSIIISYYYYLSLLSIVFCVVGSVL